MKKFMKREWVNLYLLLLFAATLFSNNGFAREYDKPSPIKTPSWPPAGQKVRCPVVRDTTISRVEGERDGNKGGATSAKLKGQQEFVG